MTNESEHTLPGHHHRHCHCCGDHGLPQNRSRRNFMTGIAAGALLAKSRLGAAGLLAAEGETPAERYAPAPPQRLPLKVQPVLVYSIYTRGEKTSWRGWGGIDSPEGADRECAAITRELASLKEKADFPVEFAEVIAVNDAHTLIGDERIARADTVVVYGAGGGVEGAQQLGRDVIIFQRWESGPVYLQYEIVSPHFLRQRTDSLQLTNITNDDIVTDSLDELLWRLRSLCGLKNTRGSRIVAIGRYDVWAQGAESQEALFKAIGEKLALDIREVPFEDLDPLIDAAAKDEQLQKWADDAARDYLALPETTCEVPFEPVRNCFVLDAIFRRIMHSAECRAITVFGCMTTIIPKANTTACLTLSTLNDDGYLAFCESDFAVVPSGILLANSPGHPVFMNDPTYPHAGKITLAHCTAPRKMSGAKRDPVRIVTHFESDFGAAPKVEMPIGQPMTNILPDFRLDRWAGLRTKVIDNPFRPICRSQIDVAYEVDDKLVAERMPGFHWMSCFGDYMNEIGYALRRVGVAWDPLG